MCLKLQVHYIIEAILFSYDDVGICKSDLAGCEHERCHTLMIILIQINAILWSKIRKLIDIKIAVKNEVKNYE